MEEEPEGGVIIGPSREALTPPGTGNTFHWDKFLLSSSVFGLQPPSNLLYQKLFWLLGETSEEEEGQTEEPETSTQEQPRFNWAHIWMEVGVYQCWQRVRLRHYSPRYFPLEPPFSFALSSTPSLCSCPGSLLDYLIFLILFSEAVPVVSSQFSVVGDRKPRDQQPQAGGVCSGQVRGWGPVWHPPRGHDLARSVHICWPTPDQEAQQVPIAMVMCLTAQETKVPLLIPWPLGSDLPTEMLPMHINIGNAHWVYCCQAKGCPEGHSSSHAAIYSHVHHTLLGTKPSAPPCFLRLTSSGSIASGHITLGLPTQLKKGYTSI